MSEALSLPIIAIVGRPNVGKSRLFNRYAGERRALVDDRPGITRDRVSAEIELDGRKILLVDTAGFEPSPDTRLATAVQAQAELAISQADAVLFVVDGKAGLLPEDEAIARTLRRGDKPLALAVNKIDIPAHLERTAEFHSLGIEPLRGISAEHGMGCFELLESLAAALPAPDPATGVDRDAGEIRIALVGRPNVGKSSLTNRLLGEERVVVSEQPGTTRDRVEVAIVRDGENYRLVDTAGLRRPGHRDRIVERGSALMTVRSLESADVAMLVVDAGEGLTDQDARVASEICDRGCAAVVLANKWDLVGTRVGGKEAKAVLEQIEHGLRFLPEPQVVPVSAKTGARLRRVLPAAKAAASAGQRRVTTVELNRWLAHVVRLHEPAASRRGGRSRRVRFLYATQTGVGPPTFLLFCNEPRAVQASYRRYLENKLREAFDFRGTPVRIRLRSKDDGGAEKGGSGLRQPRGHRRRGAREVE